MLKQLKSQHREIARLKTSGLGTTEIAEQVGMRVSSVSIILNDPLCQAHIAKLEAKADEKTIDVRKKLAELNSKAVSTIDELLSDADVSDSVKLKAAQDVLNRNGYIPIQQHQVMHAHLTSDDLRAMKERALAQGAILISTSEDS